MIESTTSNGKICNCIDCKPNFAPHECKYNEEMVKNIPNIMVNGDSMKFMEDNKKYIFMITH